MNNRKAVASLPCLLVLLSLLIQSPARADVGVPMLVYLWPGSWMLLPIIICIEAAVARRVLDMGWKKAFKVSGISNVVSSVVGIPLAWLFMLGISWGAWRYASAGGVGGDRLYDLTMPLAAMWEHESTSTIVFAAAFLCIPCFFASVWIEYLVANKLTKKEHPDLIKRWAWKANLCTYVPIIIGLLVIAFFA